MKKLMLLGGIRYLIPLIETAHEHGVYVITADYLPNNFAHKYSDEYCNVNIIDKDAVLRQAENLNIDGIMSFACDPGVDTAAFVADKMGLPSVGPYKSVHILQNKGLFRNFLCSNGFNVPAFQSYTNIALALEDYDRFHWPVIVKPTDSAGSKGVTKVITPDGLKKAIEYSLHFSHCGQFIIEDFLQQKGEASDSDSFSVDGKLEFVSFNRQFFDKTAVNPYTPAAFSWPTSISCEHQKELTNEIQRLITLLHMGTSIYNIETRECTDGKTYIMECSPRGGGNRLAECIRYATGVDMITGAMKAALGEEMEGITQKSITGNWAEVILHGRKKGRLKEVTVDPEIRNYLIDSNLWVKEGDNIDEFTGADKTIGTLIFNFSSINQRENVLKNIDEYVKVQLL